MKRMITILSCAVFLLALPLTAYAAESERNSGDGVSITVVIPNSPKKEAAPATTAKPPVNHLYPVSVWESHDNGRREIIKTYELGVGEKPEDIPRESFTREGWLYELTDITKKETASADMREHTETVTLNTETKDTEAIIKLLAATMEYQSEDGYIGVLSLDIASIKVETAGSKTETFTASATREYPHLSNNDSSLVPKTITDGGREYTLQNIEWKTQNRTTVDYDQLPDSYTAVAKYTRTGYRNIVTGYETTAVYKGGVSKIITGKTVYTASFIGVQIVTPVVNKPSDSKPEATPEPTATPIAEANNTVIEPEATLEPPVVTEAELETEAVPSPEPITEAEPTDEPETESKEDAAEAQKQSIVLPILFALIVEAIVIGAMLYCCVFRKKKTNLKEDEPDEKTD